MLTTYLYCMQLIFKYYSTTIKLNVASGEQKIANFKCEKNFYNQTA